MSRNNARAGADHPNSKLTWTEIRAIRASKEPLRVIASKYQVDPKTVRDVLANVSWHDPSYVPVHRKRGRPSKTKEVER